MKNIRWIRDGLFLLSQCATFVLMALIVAESFKRFYNTSEVWVLCFAVLAAVGPIWAMARFIKVIR